MSVREKEWHCGTKCDASPAQTNRLETVQHHGCLRRFTYRKEQKGGGGWRVEGGVEPDPPPSHLTELPNVEE